MRAYHSQFSQERIRKQWETIINILYEGDVDAVIADMKYALERNGLLSLSSRVRLEKDIPYLEKMRDNLYKRNEVSSFEIP